MSNLHLSCLTHAIASPPCRINRRPQTPLMFLQVSRVGVLRDDFYHLSYFCGHLMVRHVSVDISTLCRLYCEIFMVCNDICELIWDLRDIDVMLVVFVPIYVF
jgi:hypothetical protein